MNHLATSLMSARKLANSGQSSISSLLLKRLAIRPLFFTTTTLLREPQRIQMDNRQSKPICYCLIPKGAGWQPCSLEQAAQNNQPVLAYISKRSGWRLQFPNDPLSYCGESFTVTYSDSDRVWKVVHPLDHAPAHQRTKTFTLHNGAYKKIPDKPGTPSKDGQQQKTPANDLTKNSTIHDGSLRGLLTIENSTIHGGTLRGLRIKNSTIHNAQLHDCRVLQSAIHNSSIYCSDKLVASIENCQLCDFWTTGCDRDLAALTSFPGLPETES